MNKEALRPYSAQAQRQLAVFAENAVEVLPQEDLLKKIEQSLATGKGLRLKIGFDPTARDIHLGHVVLLRKLRKLQDLGHTVCFIVGDFTAKIGDPSGRSILRPILSDEEIAANASTYTDQAFKILDQGKTEIIYNSVWYKDMKVSDFLLILASYTVARMLERDDFSNRMKENRPLTMLELIYPLVQGYDSVQCRSDAEFGGTDQKFNLVVGRHLQETYGQPPQSIVTMPLLVGLDGKNKMSKSLGNYIGISEPAQSVFGKVMSVSDEVMWEYFRLLTDLDPEAMKEKHPKEAKEELAASLTAIYHGAEAAAAQKAEFKRVFSQNQIPQDMPVHKADKNPIDLIEVLHKTGLIPSKNEGRRLLAQGSISSLASGAANDTTLTDPMITIPTSGLVIKVGKKKFIKIVL